MDKRLNMKNRIIEYIGYGCKDEADGIGVEIELFLVNKNTLKSYNYYEKNGQKDLLKRMIGIGWILIIEENGQPLGIEKNGSTITLEPGGQVEISFVVMKDISAIEEQYTKILGEMNSALKSNQCFVAVGYHPESRIEELSLLPKERYGFMFDYFKKHGAKSHYMMKGTAATQVTIDYADEEDFIKKYRVANFIGPAISRIFDSSPIFQGELFNGSNLRIDIWNNTDQVRTKYPLKSFDENFGFENYAEYLMKIPPIITKVGKEYVFTGEEILENLVEKYEVDSIDLNQVVSMAFPDVRVKKTIEIRMADSIAVPYMFAVPALIKGILYCEDNLNYYYELSKNYTIEDIEEMNKSLLYAIDFKYKNMQMESFVNNLLMDSKKGLSSNEHYYIDKTIEMLKEEGSYKIFLSKLYKKDKLDFLKGIIL
jgi:glutamate--cysteine ligase